MTRLSPILLQRLIIALQINYYFLSNVTRHRLISVRNHNFFAYESMPENHKRPTNDAIKRFLPLRSLFFLSLLFSRSLSSSLRVAQPFSFLLAIDLFRWYTPDRLERSGLYSSDRNSWHSRVGFFVQHHPVVRQRREEG